MRAFALISCCLLAMVSCGRDKKSQEGLPPAKEWKADSSGAMVQSGKDLPAPQPPAGMGGGNPHQANPHMTNPHGTDPHAGLGGDPHAGIPGAPQAGSMAIPGPDPSRPIDPSRYVKGVIKVHEKARARTQSGTALFIVVKRADASGQATGMPLAVDKLTWSGTDLAFELTEKQAMVAGTELTGEVIVTARYDQDGDAMSKQPGDIVGTARVKLPADNVNILLDDIL